MDEPSIPATAEPSTPQLHDDDAARRSTLLRRLRVLLITSGLAFALTTWMLVRVPNPASLLGWGPGPSGVARAHLEALNRGELRVAYGLFSAQYRQQVPFQAYHELVVAHREMFHTAEVSFDTREEAGKRAVLEGHITAAGGERYRARFTMVRIEGRWWIDDLRWRRDETDRRIKT